jgi:hypothetical protein
MREFVRYAVITVVCVGLAALVLGQAATAGAVPFQADDRAAGIRLSPDLPRLTDGSAPERIVLANGLIVNLYTSEVLRGRMVTLDDTPILQLDNHRYLEVITEIDDPGIYNQGDGSFHPFQRDPVVEALSAIAHPNVRFELTVYLLPFPRRNILVSSTSGREVFLSPHVLDIQPGVGAYIVTHELGHVFHNCHVQDGSHLWNEYRRLRGITDTSRYNDSASHAYRPHEIFAEDFRVLFGGVLAAYGGHIENPALDSPVSVAGLDPFMRSLGGTPFEREPEVMASSFPNPFNPSTRIHVSVPAQVADGGAPVAAGDLDLVWDGTDRRGSAVASANYFALVRAGDERRTLKLVLLK